MLRLVAILVVCFAAGYWLLAKLIGANSAKPRGGGVAGAARGQPGVSSAGAELPDAASLSNWHLILGVKRHASKDEIKAAYKRQMGMYHPDKVASLGDEIRAVANAKAAQINAAYDLAVRSSLE